MTEDGGRFSRTMLALARIWLPLAIALTGLGLLIGAQGKGGLAAAGVVLMGSAVIVWMVNWLFRMSVQSNRERDQEEEARRYFDEHGRWPDE